MAGFGFSVSDLTTVASFAWNLYKSCKNAEPSFQEASQNAVALHTVLHELEEEADNPKSLINRSGRGKRTELIQITSGCYNTLKELENLLIRHKSLGTGNKRLRDRIQFNNADLQHIRQSLTMNTGVLNSFLSSLNSSSLGRIERKLEESIETKLDQIIRDVRSGNKNEDLLSVADDDLTDDEKAGPWEALEDELSEQGIDRETLKKHKPWIEAQLHRRLIHDSSQDEGDQDNEDSSGETSHDERDQDKEDSSDEASVSSGNSSKTIEPSEYRNQEAPKSIQLKGKTPMHRPGDTTQRSISNPEILDVPRGGHFHFSRSSSLSSISQVDDNPFSVHFRAAAPTVGASGANQIIFSHSDLSDAEEPQSFTFQEIDTAGHHDDNDYISENGYRSSSLHTVVATERENQSKRGPDNREVRMSALRGSLSGGSHEGLEETAHLDRPSPTMQVSTQRMREEHPNLRRENGRTLTDLDSSDILNSPEILLDLGMPERQSLELEWQLQSISSSLMSASSDYLRFLFNLPSKKDTQIQHPSPTAQHLCIFEDIISSLESLRTRGSEEATLRKAGLLVEAQRWVRAVSMKQIPEEKIVSYSHRMFHHSDKAEQKTSTVAILVSLEEVQWGCTKRKQLEVTTDHGGQSSQEEVEFIVPIPKGALDGFIAEVSAQDKHGCNHTVEFKLRCAPHPFFARQGTDLYHNIVVSRRETKCGWRRRITTISGESFIIKSSGLGPAEKQVFPGKGLPDFDCPWMNGSLIAVAHVHLGNCSEQEYSQRLSKMFQGVSDEEIKSDSSNSLIHL